MKGQRVQTNDGKSLYPPLTEKLPLLICYRLGLRDGHNLNIHDLAFDLYNRPIYFYLFLKYANRIGWE